MIGWSFGLALAILLLTTPTTAKAVDPDGESSLLGGLGGGVTGIVDPITAFADPVTTILEPVTEPLVEPILEPVVEPVSELAEPVMSAVAPVTTALVEPVTTALVEPVTTALVEPVTQVVAPLVEPVDDLVDPVLEPLVEPVVQPLSGIVTSVTEPIIETPTAEPEARGGTLPTAEPVQAPAFPAFDVELPAFTPILLDAPAVSAPPEPSTVTSAVAGVTGSDNAGRPAVDNGPDGSIWTPPLAFAGLVASSSAEVASSSAESEPPTPWWTRLGPIGSFGGLGSGQTLSGIAFGIGAALGILLLFLLPPPFRVSRLHLAAVFWRPQRFVGPLVPPG